MEEADFDDLFVKDPEELKKDPHTCFFENQHHAHGSRWTPNYDKCFSCSCQVKTTNTMAATKCICIQNKLSDGFFNKEECFGTEMWNKACEEKQGKKIVWTLYDK